MKEEKPIKLGPREQQIAELLLQGCDNDEIAKQLNMARRTVKAHFNRLFLRFGINGGIKRVKLATFLYRRQACSSATENGLPASESSESLNSWPKDSKTKKLPTPSELPSTSSRTTCESSTTSSDSGTGSSLPSGMKPGDRNGLSTHKNLESWERRILGLGDEAVEEAHYKGS
jgi:Bacterial regulatory proteins, luxR family